MFIRVCDKCKRKADPIENDRTYEVPNGWVSFSIKFSYTKNYYLCPMCAKELGLAGEKKEKEKTLEENLLDILYEIAENVVSDQGQ